MPVTYFFSDKTWERVYNYLITHSLSKAAEIYKRIARPDPSTTEGALRITDFEIRDLYDKLLSEQREATEEENQLVEITNRAWRDYCEEWGWELELIPDSHNHEERTLIDIIHRLQNHDYLSPRQRNYLESLAEKIDSRQAEKIRLDKAPPVPQGYRTIKGVLINAYQVDEDELRGPNTALLIQAVEGYKVWGKLDGIDLGLNRGDKIRVFGRVTQSKTDTKFGFIEIIEVEVVEG